MQANQVLPQQTQKISPPLSARCIYHVETGNGLTQTVATKLEECLMS